MMDFEFNEIGSEIVRAHAQEKKIPEIMFKNADLLQFHILPGCKQI